MVSDDFKTDPERDHLDIDQLINEPLIQITATLDKSWEEKIKILNKLTEKLRKQISYVAITKETYGIIAGDVHGYNQHFQEIYGGFHLF